MRRPLMDLENLEERLVPVVGATAMPPGIVGDSAGNWFHGVVRLNDSLGGGCTGSLLSTGRHILIAAHCVDLDVDTSVPPDGRPDIGDGVRDAKTISVTFELANPSTITADSRTITIAGIANNANNVFLHPNWNGDWHRNDVAIIQLPALAPLGAERYNLYRNTNEVGQAFTVVGYGATGTGSDPDGLGPLMAGHDSSFGTKRQGQNLFDAVAQNGTTLRLDLDNVANEAITAPGDSGGPSFLASQLAGITSFGNLQARGFYPQGGSAFGSNAEYTRVSAFLGTSANCDAVVFDIDCVIGGVADLIVDMNSQPQGSDGLADTIELRESAGVTTVLINGRILQTTATNRINTIRVIGSGDSDRLFVNGNLGKRVQFDGGAGVDHVTYKGDGSYSGTYVPGASTAIAGGSVSLSGSFQAFMTTIQFTGLEASSSVTVQNLLGIKLGSPNARDVYTITSTSSGNRISGTSGGVTIVPITTSNAPAIEIDSASADGFGPNDIDTITVKSLAKGTSLEISTGAGDDVTSIGANTLDAIYGVVTVDGGAGTNTLNLNDKATADTSTRINHVAYDLTDGRVVRTNQPVNPTTNLSLPALTETITHRNMHQLNVIGGSTGNRFRMTTAVAGPAVNFTAGNMRDDIDIQRSFSPLTILAGGGDDFIDLHRSDAAVTIDSGDGDDTINISRTRQVLTDIAGPVTIKAGTGSDLVNVNDGARTGATSLSMYGDQLTDPTGAWRGSVKVDSTLERMILVAGSGDNWIDVQSLSATTAASIYTVGGNDTIRLYAGIAGILKVDGGAGADTLDYTGNVAAVTVDLARGTATAINGIPAGIENATGGAGNDLLIGHSSANVLRGGPGLDSLFGGLGSDILEGGGDNDLVVGDTVAFGLDAALNLQQSSSQWFNWGGLREKWLVDGSNAWLFITPSGELFRWDGASGPGHSVPLRGNRVAQLNPVFYEEPNYLTSARPGMIEISPAAVITAKSLDNRYGFGPVQFNAPDGTKWFQGQTGAWFYMGGDGNVYPEIESQTFPGPVGTVDPVFYAQPELLTSAADSATANAVFDLDRTLGLWSDGAFAQNSSGRNEKWIRDSAGTWYTIETDGSVLKDGLGTALATLDASYWSDPSRLYNAYTSRLITVVTAAQGYPDNDVLLGTDGDDVLIGGAGRNLLIAGRGADTLYGGVEQDILIAGYTAFDDQALNFSALDSIVSRWSDGSLTFDERVGALTNGSVNPTVLTPYVPVSPHWIDQTGDEGSGTVHNDSSIDRLIGGADRDWFFAAVDDALVDLTALDRIDWIRN